jgi:hypothetical protein
LKHNVDLNSFDNITLFNVALSDRSGEVGFSDRASDDQNCVEESGAPIKVKTLPLDDICLGDRPEIALLKIDVEGYEKFVLMGALKTLPSVQAIYFEASDAAYRRFGYGFLDIHDLLVGSGFTLLKLKDGQVAPIPPGYCCTVTENLLAVRDLARFLARTNAAADRSS